MNIKGIVDAYREGGFETRLHLFLHYRDLRDEFEDVERREELEKERKSE